MCAENRTYTWTCVKVLTLGKAVSPPSRPSSLRYISTVQTLGLLCSKLSSVENSKASSDIPESSSNLRYEQSKACQKSWIQLYKQQNTPSSTCSRVKMQEEHDVTCISETYNVHHRTALRHIGVSACPPDAPREAESTSPDAPPHSGLLETSFAYTEAYAMRNQSGNWKLNFSFCTWTSHMTLPSAGLQFCIFSKSFIACLGDINLLQMTESLMILALPELTEWRFHS